MGLRKRIRFFIAKYISKILSEFYEESMRIVQETYAPAKEESEENISNEYKDIEDGIGSKEHVETNSIITDEILKEWLYGEEDDAIEE